MYVLMLNALSSVAARRLLRAQESRSHATLDPPPYAASGHWAVNVWAKLAPGALAQGKKWSYVLGQAGAGGWTKGEGPNKVRSVSSAWLQLLVFHVVGERPDCFLHML
jgi:hypothetical protein